MIATVMDCLLCNYTVPRMSLSKLNGISQPHLIQNASQVLQFTFLFPTLTGRPCWSRYRT